MFIKKIKSFFDSIFLDNYSWTRKLEDNKGFIEGMQKSPTEIPLIREIPLRLVKANSRVLSAGCGPGREVKFLVQELGCAVTAIDISENMINLSKKHEKNAEYILGDISKFKSKKKFDYIICLFNTINYLPGLEARKEFIENCDFNLKNTGKLIITTGHRFSSVRAFIFQLLHPTKNYYYLPSQIDKWFENTSFKVERSKIDHDLLLVATKS